MPPGCISALPSAVVEQFLVPYFGPFELYCFSVTCSKYKGVTKGFDGVAYARKFLNPVAQRTATKHTGLLDLHNATIKRCSICFEPNTGGFDQVISAYAHKDCITDHMVPVHFLSRRFQTVLSKRNLGKHSASYGKSRRRTTWEFCWFFNNGIVHPALTLEYYVTKEKPKKDFEEIDRAPPNETSRAMLSRMPLEVVMSYVIPLLLPMDVYSLSVSCHALRTIPKSLDVVAYGRTFLRGALRDSVSKYTSLKDLDSAYKRKCSMCGGDYRGGFNPYTKAHAHKGCSENGMVSLYSLGNPWDHIVTNEGLVPFKSKGTRHDLCTYHNDGTVHPKITVQYWVNQPEFKVKCSAWNAGELIRRVRMWRLQHDEEEAARQEKKAERMRLKRKRDEAYKECMSVVKRAKFALQTKLQLRRIALVDVLLDLPFLETTLVSSMNRKRNFPDADNVDGLASKLEVELGVLSKPLCCLESVVTNYDNDERRLTWIVKWWAVAKDCADKESTYFLKWRSCEHLLLHFGPERVRSLDLHSLGWVRFIKLYFEKIRFSYAEVRAMILINQNSCRHMLTTSMKLHIKELSAPIGWVALVKDYFHKQLFDRYLLQKVRQQTQQNRSYNRRACSCGNTVSSACTREKCGRCCEGPCPFHNRRRTGWLY